jgi:5'-3' exonuclease
VLVGDSTDNYPGLPGCGPVKAEKILEKVQPEESYVPHLQLAYAKAGLSFADLATQLNVARILTTKTYDFEKKEPILWSI